MERWLYVALIAAPVAALACTGLIGTRDLSYDPTAENGGGGEGGSVDGGVGGGGDGGPGSNDAALSQTCDADIKTDRSNCGACGQDCSNGQCAAGVCTLGQGQYGANGIAIDNSNAYVAVADGHVVSCAKNGCFGGSGPKVLLVNSDTEPQRIHVVNGQLYFSSYYDGMTETTGVYRIPADHAGAPERLTPLGQTQVFEMNIDQDASTIYWSNDDDPGKGWHTCPIANCPDGGGTQLDAEQALYDSIFLPNGALVWSSDSGVHYCASPPSCAGAASTLLYKDQTGWGSALAYDDAKQLLLIGLSHNTGTDKIVSCPAVKAACNPVDVATGLKYPRGVAAGGGVVYFTEAGSTNGTVDMPTMDGAVSKCVLNATGGCGPVIPIATGLLAANRITLDANSIYWTNEGLLGNFGVAGSIMKAPR